MNDLLNVQIKDAAPHIFKRPFLSVDQNAQLLQVTPFLVIGPQIYVDGIIVIDDDVDRGKGRPVGRIGSKHIISSILNEGYPNWLHSTASEIMDTFVGALEMHSPLSMALDIFKKTKIAFVPILTPRKEEDDVADDLTPIASFAIRDVLPLIRESNFEIPIKQLSSPLISVDRTTSIKDILDYMMNRGIRNIGIKEDLSAHKNNHGFGGDKDRRHAKLLGIINDRKILEFLLSHNGREAMRKNGIAGLAEVSIMDNLDMASISKVNPNTTVSDAAELLMDIRNPYLIVGREEGKDNEEDNWILTPWDIVT
jgi:CBS domain-containing protein